MAATWSFAPSVPAPAPAPAHAEACCCQGDWNAYPAQTCCQVQMPQQDTCCCWEPNTQIQDAPCCRGDFQPPCCNQASIPVYCQTYQPQCVCQDYQEPIPCPCQEWSDLARLGCFKSEYQSQYCGDTQQGACEVCPCCQKRTLSPGMRPMASMRRPHPEMHIPTPCGSCHSVMEAAPPATTVCSCPVLSLSAPAAPPVCPCPCDSARFSLATSPLEHVTVYSASYQPLNAAACRATPARPRDNLRTPGAIPLARNCAPSFCASPPPPAACPPRDHRGAVTPAGQCPMSNITINRASYQPVPQLPRDQCPWVPVQGYPYPWPPLESTTVYNASYMPPGCVAPPGFLPSRPTTVSCPASPPCYA